MKLYKESTYPVSVLVQDIRLNKVALPDIQRPFVWTAAQVRNLFDSMYRGYPVGYLLFWETGVSAGSRRIASGESGVPEEAPANLIIDGQQRSTALYAVMTAEPVLRKDYTKTKITIAFRPTDGAFEVGNAAVKQSPEYLADISPLFDPEVSPGSIKRSYLKRLRSHREVDEAEEDRIEAAFEQLRAIAKYEFRVVVLSANADVEEVSEIFVRINSAGSELNKSDFLLTLMSVFWEAGRRDLEKFCADSRISAPAGKESPFNWHIQPKPAQLLRACIALAFQRANLASVYALLRGRNSEGGPTRADQVNEQFATLAKAQESVLDLANWHGFLQCLELAGFRGKKMIAGDNAVIYSYVMWLIGRIEYRVPHDRLRNLIAKWFFMAHTTSRYSGSFESLVERDLAHFEEVRDGKGFCTYLESIIDASLTNDFWDVTLPNSLGTSAGKSPALSAYIAALNILDADALLSRVKVRSRLDPSVLAIKGIERQHLFSKSFLTDGWNIKDRRQINNIANMVLVDWPRAAVAENDPAEFWAEQVAASRLPEDLLRRHMYWHALPENWFDLPYTDFLAQRRRLMAAVVRDGFRKFASASYHAEYPAPATAAPESARKVLMDLKDLVAVGHLSGGDILSNSDDNVEALILDDGRIDLGDEVYETPNAAAAAASGSKANGMTYWSVDLPEDGVRNLHQLVEDALQGWGEIDIELLADPAAQPLVQGMWVAGAPVPQFGTDQVDGWEAELAWPHRKIAVLNGVSRDAAQRLAAFETAGWQAKIAADWTIVDLIHAMER